MDKQVIMEIKNLHVEAEKTSVLNGINLVIRPGELHALMGPNGSGKSTLAKAIAGHPGLKVTQGEINYLVDGRMISLLELEIDERSKKGVFLGLQYPIEIPGITNFNFLLESFNAICESQGIPHMSPDDFKKFLKSKLEILHMEESFLDREVNKGFSGGEKKKNEILQMTALNPRLAILDETDSGLDIDALKIVAKGINAQRNSHNGILLITHYQRLLNHTVPDFVHVLSDGKIVRSGGQELAVELEQKGYV